MVSASVGAEYQVWNRHFRHGWKTKRRRGKELYRTYKQSKQSLYMKKSKQSKKLKKKEKKRSNFTCHSQVMFQLAITGIPKLLS
jgi:hypothetical protein